MYFSMIFRARFSKDLSFLTPLDGSFSNVVSNYVKSRQHFQIPVFEPDFFQFQLAYKKKCLRFFYGFILQFSEIFIQGKP